MEGFDWGPIQGLLGMFEPNEDEKKKARMEAIMAAGLGLLGTPRGHELQGIGQAGINYLTANNSALRDLRSTKTDALKTASAAIGVQKSMQEMQDDQAMRKVLSGMPAAGGGGNKLYEQLIAKGDQLQSAGLPMQAQQYYVLAEKYAPKYKGIETQMQDGKPVSLQTFENRPPEILSGFQPKPEYKEVGTGQEKFFYDPLSGQRAGSFQMQMTPGEVASNKVAQGQLGISAANLDISRQRLAHDIANEGKPQIVTGPNGEVFTVDPRRGVGAPVVGPDGQPMSKGEKPLTESQAKATAYANQMAQATREIAQLEQKGFTGQTVMQQFGVHNASGQGLPYVPGSGTVQRSLSSDLAQKYSQAQLQWTEAALRFMTGANAPEAEVVRNAATYFPRPGDKPEVVAQKAAARLEMEQSIRLAAGQGVQKLPEVSGVTGRAGSQAGNSLQNDIDEARRRGLIR